MFLRHRDWGERCGNISGGGELFCHRSRMNSSTYDIAIIGAGVVGLSFAMQAAEQFPHLRILILEKENGVARRPDGFVVLGLAKNEADAWPARRCLRGISLENSARGHRANTGGAAGDDSDQRRHGRE